MASSSDDAAATETLIAQLMAEDLGESYYRHSAPVGASYHDYEEPLSSYERQCLDAANHPDEEGEAGSGWGLEDPDEVNTAMAPDEGPHPTGQSDGSKWDSRFVNEDGLVEEHAAYEESEEQSREAAELDEDGNHSDSICCPNPTNEDLTASPARVVSPPTSDPPTNPVGENPNISPPTTLSTQLTPNIFPVLPSTHPAPNSQPPAPSRPESSRHWDDGLDYSSSKGKSKAVRAYDEFKQGLRHGEKESWAPRVVHDSENAVYDSEAEAEDEDEEEVDDETADEALNLIHIPWPSTATDDDLLARREDADVVEIRLSDDETLESILRDISLRDERRKRGEDVEGWVGAA
ncbi:hypothetical protein IMSHALPRED_002781 [Imshaugia aleurites]|uniref:Uncharacterized protein n=1 Tax=Imshaugia aleurites TaxID=172621 RepID=A0A8H3J6A1_9LECA|nr:hypothetical protein IMSHALPRED_002781 [Imshaugia aleurites]